MHGIYYISGLLRTGLCTALLCICFQLSQAQDLHFSQYFSVPHQINAANTGYFNGDYRIGLDYKYQWPWGIQNGFSTFNTYTAFADISFLDNKINETDWMGFGVGLFAGSGRRRDDFLPANTDCPLAYHKGLNKYNRVVLSFGAGLRFVQRSIDFDRLYFNNQWNDREFDLTIDNLEPFNSESNIYMDLHAGLNFSCGFDRGYSNWCRRLNGTY